MQKTELRLVILHDICIIYDILQNFSILFSSASFLSFLLEMLSKNHYKIISREIVRKVQATLYSIIIYSMRY